MKRWNRFGDIRRAVMALVVLCVGLPLSAQIDNTDTIYSRFGVGRLYGFGSSQSEAMGGASAGVVTVNYLNLTNPAAWADQVYTRFSAGFSYSALQSKNSIDSLSTVAGGLLNVLDFGFPLLERKLGMVLSLQPYSRVGYITRSIGVLEEQFAEPETEYLSVLEGDGGLELARAGLGWRLNRNLAVGASVDFIFGMIDYSRLTQLANDFFYLNEVGTTTSTRMYGLTGTLGLAFTLPNLNEQGGRLSVGGAVTLPASLNSTQVTTLVQESRSDTLGNVLTGETQLPLRSRFGISFKPNGSFLFAVEGRYESWSKFSSTVPLAGYEVGGASIMSDSKRLGGGLEWSPSGGIFHPNFFRRSLYRLGAYAEQAYYMPGPNLAVRTFAATAGMSMPSLFPGTYVDLNAEFGTRGSTASGLVRDLYLTLSATINFGERWFVKRRFR